MTLSGINPSCNVPGDPTFQEISYNDSLLRDLSPRKIIRHALPCTSLAAVSFSRMVVKRSIGSTCPRDAGQARFEFVIKNIFSLL